MRCSGWLEELSEPLAGEVAQKRQRDFLSGKKYGTRLSGVMGMSVGSSHGVSTSPLAFPVVRTSFARSQAQDQSFPASQKAPPASWAAGEEKRWEEKGLEP